MRVKNRYIIGVLIVVLLAVFGCAAEESSNDLGYFDIEIKSEGVDDPEGTLAVRVYPPKGESRYEEGAPVLIWAAGGYEIKGLDSDLMDLNRDFVIVTYIYPGGEDTWAGRSSDGVYDDRGENCILALKDVLLFASGELADIDGDLIDEVVGVPVMTDNVGMIGVSNGGNIIVAVAALYGEYFADSLQYIVQWETPVSGQIATRDLGRIVYDFDTGRQGDFFNPRFVEYRQRVIDVDLSDLAYDPSGDYYIVFSDGDGDGVYTTVSHEGVDTPDVNLDGELSLDEDFPFDYYPMGEKRVYSRSVTYALEKYSVFDGEWPSDIATVSEADEYWDIRESVVLYDQVVEKNPDIEAMVLANVYDHVQSSPNKLHLRQAFEGWFEAGAWVKINPSSSYVNADVELPDNVANEAPDDWFDIDSYCVPESVESSVYQLGAVWEMMDRAYKRNY